MAYNESRKYENNTSTQSLLGKTLPNNVDAEKSVLAAILLNGNNITLVSDFLKPKDFYLYSHQMIYQVLFDLAQENKKLDLVVIQDELQIRKQLENIGGIGYLLELQEDIPSIGLIKDHAEIVKNKSILRELIDSAAQIITTCYDKNIDNIHTVLDHAEKKVFEITNKITPSGFIKIDSLLKTTFKNLAEIKASQEGVTGIPTGYSRLDTLTSGLQNGDLFILAARPSMGKTAFALNIALNAARENFSVGIFSMEMSSEQLTLRMLSSESLIPHQKIRNASVSSEEWMELTNTAARLAETQMFIDDTPALNIMELRAKARKLKAKYDINLLVIDYLQLMNSHRRHENRTQEISEISRSLKALAKELSIPIIALSQLSRSLESRMDKHPQLSDLRESGAIEQDADIVSFIYRDVIYNPDTENTELAEIIIGKQRNGPVGTVPVRFIGEITKFEEWNE